MQSGGFTLVEVMVAISILLLILLATISALRTFGNTSASVDTMIARVDEVRSVSSFLRELTESSVVGASSGELSLGASASTPSHFLHGENFFELNTAVLFGELYGGHFQVRVASEEGQLVLRWREVSSKAEDDWPLEQKRVLLQNLNAFSVQALSRENGAWQAFNERARGPVLLRIQVQSEGRRWPVLSMQVRR